MLVKWVIERGYADIQRLECTRETEQSVWFLSVPFSIGGLPKETKVKKYGGRLEYHDTWKDAHQSLMIDADGDILAARRALERAHSHMGNVKGQKPPPEAGIGEA